MLFRLVPSENSGIDFVNTLVEDDSLNIIQYLYYYNGGGVAVGDINNDELPDIYFSANRSSNRLFLNRGKDKRGRILFDDITDEAGVGGEGNWSTGVNMVDINADGWLDIYLCQVGGYKSFNGKNQVFINQGCNSDESSDIGCAVSFRNEASTYGLEHQGFSTQSAFFDYDLDGDLDMYLLCHSVHSTESYRDTSTTRIRDPKAGDKLFENKVNESKSDEPYFIDVSERAGILGGVAGYGLGIAIGDVDENGFPDVYIGNDFHENDFLYLNQGNGTFREKSTSSFGHTSYASMGNDLADINNDGLLDLVTLDMKPDDEFLLKSAQGPDTYGIYRFKRSFGYHHQLPRNMLQINQGLWESDNGWFHEIGQMQGMSATDWSWSALLADFDMDGWKDLHVTNGIIRRPNDLDYLKYISNRKIQEEASDLSLAAQMPSGKTSNLMFSNRQGEKFIDVTEDWGLTRLSFSNGAAYADFDNDGDLDIVVNNINDHAFLYENLADHYSSNDYITIKCRGPENNPSGLGTSATIYNQGTSQFQELYVTRGWQSSVEHEMHFGLGKDSRVDSILLRWPDRKVETLYDVQLNQTLVVKYSDARPEMLSDAKSRNKIFERAENIVAFRHQENIFNDNNREPLIPYLLSTQGPKIAVADVNGDKIEDLFVGGASGQPGALFTQTKTGSFIAVNALDLEKDAKCEDTGSAFVDVDNDGDKDLYIGSGGNQYYLQDSLLMDRLYINDGSGNFSIDRSRVPSFFNQTSCVKASDFDEDGDMDLFVGSQSVAVHYGQQPNSYLLINDGDGYFELAEKQFIDLIQLGMVTDATWTDIDQDRDLDIVVVGHWMPPTIFTNMKGTFVKSSLPLISGSENDSFGWWNTIEAADLDGDGDQDLVVGNFGLNSNLQPSIAEPIKLYVGDFDNNLSTESILSYYRQGKEFPLVGLDPLAKQLIYLKKEFRSYAEFAASNIQEVFSPSQLEQAEVFHATTFSTVVAVNDGAGNFHIKTLPLQVQASTTNAIHVHDFNEDGLLDLLLAGNFDEIQPAIGRMDASIGTLLFGTGAGNFEVADNDILDFRLDGQIRDLDLIHLQGKQMILAARNNASILTYIMTPTQ
ncbi:MAG: VCBS repeat-containing protein [Saprospiraceae bacterium]|nr:VCBS repeat-containing protein [Saprospiraceae bacterium]